ncbi:hypothetical protein [Halopiger xanaduensis]|uniref:hypothetical protein n=1 Tax=Halopiger xanaduensis TaxID=387343 RepID=UPI000B166EEA|nr:hypothetical protein [Halopiger xanaduensis]
MGWPAATLERERPARGVTRRTTRSSCRTREPDRHDGKATLEALVEPSWSHDGIGNERGNRDRRAGVTDVG